MNTQTDEHTTNFSTTQEQVPVVSLTTSESAVDGSPSQASPKKDTVCVTNENDNETESKDVENLDHSEEKLEDTKDNDPDPLGPLRAAIGHEVDLLNQKMVAKMGMPQNKGEVPTLKVLCDAFIFYNENRREVKDPKDILNINMAMLIGDRMERILDSANVLYSLSERKFLETLKQYIDTKNVIELPLNSREVVEKRAKIIEGMKIAKETAMAKSREKLRAQPKASSDQGQVTDTKLSNSQSPPQTARSIPEKKCCAVCQLPENSVKLIKVANSPETTNKMICLKCMNKQKTEHQIKYTQIKNDKVYLKDLPKCNTR